MASVFVRLVVCWAWALAMVGVYTPRVAHAYCRETLDASTEGPCNPDPNLKPLTWSRSCLSYVFNPSIFQRVQMGEAFVRNTFNTAYQTWSDVPCTGDPPFLVWQSPGTTATNRTEFLYDQPNEAIVTMRSASEWTALPDHDRNALALTLLWHAKSTGDILDVDMELNAGIGNFTDCARANCVNGMVDLQNTVTHEAGHLLGLGHSTVPGSTMQARTTSGPETQKRSLEDDDVRGYCALMLPSGPCSGASCVCTEAPIFPSRHAVSACGCRVVGENASSRSALAVGCMVLGIACARARRRKRSWRWQTAADTTHD